jgi:glyoxylase-like metal-dependent hydrolase (beta-lactamase superfamily II)
MACLLICGVVVSLVASDVSAQRGPAADPLVRANATVKLAEHSYVIPDNSVGLVPNVGIVAGNRATLVIDPGLGRRNGETVLREVAKVSKNTELYMASTHFHAEHTAGYVAFPPLTGPTACKWSPAGRSSSRPRSRRTFPTSVTSPSIIE